MSARLTGSHLQTVDDRNRLAVPAKLVSTLRELSGVTEADPLEVVVTVSPNKRIGIYPKTQYLQMIEELEGKSLTDPDAEELLVTYLNYMEEQPLDKQNRCRIPQSLAEDFSIAGEVVVLGSGKFLEVVNKSVWSNQLKERVEKMRELEVKSKLRPAGAR